MLTKSTYTYADHGVPLECDVYKSDDHDPEETETPIFLFFHSGGFCGGARDCVPPWLAQACYRRGWILMSASYRLLPQAGADGLLDDARAAYEFAQLWGTSVTGAKRRVIVGGASAGFLLANLIAHHAKPSPVALLGITGIPTIRHSFFDSSTLLTPSPIKDEDAKQFLTGPPQVGSVPAHDTTVFAVERLEPSGQRNLEYIHPSKPDDQDASETPDAVARGDLYDYWLYKNAFLGLLGDVDPGFQWAVDEPEGAKLKDWPPTVFIQGNEDMDVVLDVTTSAVNSLGPNKTRLCLAKGQGHLFEATSFYDDETAGMSSVREAVAHLDSIIDAL